MKAEQWRIAVMRLGALLGDFHLEKVRLGPAWANVEYIVQPERPGCRLGNCTLRCCSESSPSRCRIRTATRRRLWIVSMPFSQLPARYYSGRGRGTIEFSKIAIPVLNQVVRPFTARWHRESLAGAFDDPDKTDGVSRSVDSFCRLTCATTIGYWRKSPAWRDLTDLELTTDMVHGSN